MIVTSKNSHKSYDVITWQIEKPRNVNQSLTSTWTTYIVSSEANADGSLAVQWYFISRNKLRIFNTNVKSILLYCSETWRVTKANSTKLQTFVNKFLRSIMGIHWPEIITNEELWTTTEQERINIQIRRRKWGWIGYTLKKTNCNVTKQPLRWNPQGKRSGAGGGR